MIVLMGTIIALEKEKRVARLCESTSRKWGGEGKPGRYGFLCRIRVNGEGGGGKERGRKKKRTTTLRENV